MAVTLSTLRTQVYNLLREEENSNSYPYTLVDQMINNAQLDICTGQVLSQITGDVVRKGKLPFLHTDKFYSNVQTTTLSADVSVGDTTISVSDTSNFPSTGKIFINGNVITYTGTTSTTFTGCSNINFAHKSGSGVGIIFDLPDDYSTSIQVIYNYNFKLDNKEYDTVFEDLNSIKNNRTINTQSNYNNLSFIKPFYSIINGQYLAVFNLDENGGIIHLRYEKTPTELVNTSDTATIDNDTYTKGTIPYIAAGEMLFNRGEENRGSIVTKFGIGKLKSMYNFYNNQGYENISGVQYKSGKSNNFNF